MDSQSISDSSPLVTYVTTGFNSRRYIRDCLDSILADSPTNSEIIFVSNGCADGSLELLHSQYPTVRVIANDRNIGHCRAVNQSLREARGKYIILLDIDTSLSPGTTSTMLKCFEENPDIFCAAPRMLNPDGSIQETARNFPSPLNGLFGRQTLLARWFPNNPITVRYLDRQNLNNTDPFQVGWVSAACMVFPRAILDKVGYWDEGYEGYWVDCDWCKRIEEHGGEIFCVPAAKVWHFEQNRPGRNISRSRAKLFNRGSYRFYMLHHTLGRFDPRAMIVALLLWLRTEIQCFVGFLSAFSGSRAAEPKPLTDDLVEEDWRMRPQSMKVD